MDLGIQGKTAFVPASTGGLGLAVALALAAEGANLVITGRRGEEATFRSVDILVLNGPGPAPGTAAGLSSADMSSAFISCFGPNTHS